jgi:hypothetical protein
MIWNTDSDTLLIAVDYSGLSSLSQKA